MRIITFLLLGLFITLSSFSSKNQQEEKTVKAYTFNQNTLCEGFIYYIQTERGYKLTQYQFTIGGEYVNGRMNGEEKFMTLNPNSDLAKKYSFTHYVDFQGKRAFIIR